MSSDAPLLCPARTSPPRAHALDLSVARVVGATLKPSTLTSVNCVGIYHPPR